MQTAEADAHTPCRLASRHRFPRANMSGRRPPTIVVVHEDAGVLELIEATLNDRGARVLATRDPLEALEIVRRLKVDLLVISRALNDANGDVRALRPGVSVVILYEEPMALDEIADAVVAAVELDGNGRGSA
jgi:DNA-binding NtrC family response regulator